MIDKNELTKFIIKARTKTYAGNTGKTESILEGSRQFEYKEENWLYRDIYNQGNKKFIGLETVYFKNQPIFSMSYYGNFEKITEEEADKILRRSLKDNFQKARLWHNIVFKINEYIYTNKGSGDIDEMEGSEKIEKNGKSIYFFYYAGAFIG